MYSIYFTYIYHKNQPNVGEYTIHVGGFNHQLVMIHPPGKG